MIMISFPSIPPSSFPLNHPARATHFCHSLENKILWDDSKNMIDQELTLHLDKTSKRKRAQEKAQEIVPFITHS